MHSLQFYNSGGCISHGEMLCGKAGISSGVGGNRTGERSVMG